MVTPNSAVIRVVSRVVRTPWPVVRAESSNMKLNRSLIDVQVAANFCNQLLVARIVSYWLSAIGLFEIRIEGVLVHCLLPPDLPQRNRRRLIESIIDN